SDRVVRVHIHIANAAAVLVIEAGEIHADRRGLQQHGGRQMGVLPGPCPITGRAVHKPELAPAHHAPLPGTLLYARALTAETSPILPFPIRSGGTSLVTTAPAPIRQSFPTVTLFPSVAFTPKKQFAPTSQNPDTTTCDEMKQWSPILEWCPM